MAAAGEQKGGGFLGLFVTFFVVMFIAGVVYAFGETRSEAAIRNLVVSHWARVDADPVHFEYYPSAQSPPMVWRVDAHQWNADASAQLEGSQSPGVWTGLHTCCLAPIGGLMGFGSGVSATGVLSKAGTYFEAAEWLKGVRYVAIAVAGVASGFLVGKAAGDYIAHNWAPLRPDSQAVKAWLNKTDNVRALVYANYVTRVNATADKCKYASIMSGCKGFQDNSKNKDPSEADFKAVRDYVEGRSAPSNSLSLSDILSGSSFLNPNGPSSKWLFLPKSPSSVTPAQ
jgi:hypothetical protein